MAEKKYLDQNGLLYVVGELDKKFQRKETGKGLSTNDYTTDEKNKLVGIEEGAEVNQNAFTNITVGTTKIEADTKSDTLIIAGENGVTVAGDADNDSITISNSGVRAVTTSATDGAISVNTNGTVADVVVVSDIATIRSGAALGATAQQPATTIAGYGITDAYTKTEIDAKITSVMRYKGNVATKEELPTENVQVGDFYNALDTGDNFAWNGESWDAVGTAIDISGKQDVISDLETIRTNASTGAGLKTKVDGIADGAQVNVIESVKVNGSALAISDKAVDITVPAITDTYSATSTDGMSGVAVASAISSKLDAADLVTISNSDIDKIIADTFK